MEITKDVFKGISSTVSEFVKNKQYELEIKYNGKITRDAFVNTLQYLRTQGYKESEHKEVLDVIFMYNGFSYRISIEGKDNIQSYCLTNTITTEMIKEVISKRFVNNFKPIIISDFNLKVDLKQEVQINDIKINELLVYAENALKGFRYKKRYSYTPKNGLMRYDCTVVKRSNNINDEFLVNKRFSTSNILSSSEQYELELEVLKREKITDVEDVAKQFIKSGIQLYAIVNGIENVISKKEKMEVLEGYLSLWSKKFSHGMMARVLQKPKLNFIGPQPVTLELRNVVSDGLGVDTILNDYTVTEKADGERYLLHVSKAGRLYLINNKLDVFPLDIELNNMSNCIFDGEYITRDMNGRKIKIFAMFDVYFCDGKDTRALSLISEDESIETRVGIMETFCKRFKERFSKTLILHVKKFHFDQDIFKSVKKLLSQINTDSFVYRIDGMIFTPKSLPVGGLYKDSEPDAMGPWMKLLKWKPPAENTIDMQVKENGKSAVTVVNGKIMKVYKLYIGYQPNKWEPIKPKEYLENKVVKDTRYTVIPFSPAGVLDREIEMFYAEIEDESGIAKCKNGDDILNNSIVEFAYVNNTKLAYPLRWVPLRVRKDKTLPNDYSTAMNVWRSIEIPVTEAIISGDEKVYSKDIPAEDVYYKRNISRDKFASKNMMTFHNYWNKYHFLISKYASKSLFDIACGMGGDLKRWLDAGISTVYGIDKVRNNIENPSDGIYSRMMDMNITNKEYIFGTMDASKLITDQYVRSQKNEDDVFIGEKLLKYGKFDNVSCQFAIHYFFESEKILDTFIANVNNFLKEGGYFFGTCLDGNKVKKLLKDVAKDDSISGKKDDRILWNIRKGYDESENDAPRCGEEISIYMESIGLEMPEYLVNISILIDKFQEYGIVPVDIRSFEDTYKEVINMDKADVNEYYWNAVKNMSDVEKEYSFMNMLFVFKKTSSPISSTATTSSSSSSQKKKKVILKKST